MQDLPDLTPTEVKAFRASQGMSQSEMAATIGVSVNGVQKWELQGAPQYWRYVFAAVQNGLKPWQLSVADKMNAIQAGEPGKYEISLDEVGDEKIYNLLEHEAQKIINRDLTLSRVSYAQGNVPTRSFIVEFE